MSQNNNEHWQRTRRLMFTTLGVWFVLAIFCIGLETP